MSRLLRSSVLLVLLPACGLLAVGIVSLWRSARAIETEATAEASRSAVALARSIREWLGTPELLDSFPAARCFRVEEGQIVVPTELGWLGRPTAEHPARRLTPRMAARLDEARLLEFAVGDARAAGLVYEEILGHDSLAARERGWVLLQAAWNAHRGGDREHAERWLAELLDVSARPYRSVVAGTLLLCAAAGVEATDKLVESAVSLGPDEAEALLARLRERGAPAATIERVAHLVDRGRVQRETLLAARRLTPVLEGSAGPLTQVVGSGRFFYFPDTAERGQGAFLPGDLLVEALETWRRESLAAGLPWGGAIRLTQGAARSPDAAEGAPAEARSIEEIPAGPGLVVVPRRLAGDVPLARPWILTALLVVLGAVLVFGLIQSLRSLRRERAALEVRADFLQAVSHEIKTPLSSIRLLAEMLLSDRVEGETKRREYHRNLAAEAGRLSVLIENVLDLGRIERDERSYDMRVMAAAEVVSEAVEIFRPVAEADRLSLHVDLRERRALVRADRGALLQVFLNVMENARRYASQGSRLDISAHVEDATWRARFRDRGPGIEPEEREIIFGKFKRGAAACRGGNPGVGLGLYLSRRLLQAHGGGLDCEAPDDGKAGALFVAWLPVAADRRDDGA